MKMQWFAWSALPLLAVLGMPELQKSGGAAQVSATQAAPSPKGKLTRVAREDGDQDKPERFDRESWRKRLATGDLEERVRAFDELAGVARRNGDAHKALEEWSKDGQDSELAWTSRLLLREVDRNPWRASLGWGGLKPRGGMGMNFDFDGFARRFDDLDSMFDDLRSQWGDMLHSLPAPSGGSKSSAKSMTLQVGPDGGVTCDVTENVDGKEQKHTYSAGSLDELLEAHPELRGSLGGTTIHMFGLPGRTLRVNPHGLTPSTPRALPGDLDGFDVSPDSSGEPPTDKLGIHCLEVEEDRASELGIDAGVGLSVEEVVPGTIASVLGLKRGDVVIEVNGATVHGTDDVKKALHDRAANDDVSVVVVGGNGHKRTLTWKPKPPADKPADKSGQTEVKSGSRHL